jgi:hypothetical protein
MVALRKDEEKMVVGEFVYENTKYTYKIFPKEYKEIPFFVGETSEGALFLSEEIPVCFQKYILIGYLESKKLPQDKNRYVVSLQKEFLEAEKKNPEMAWKYISFRVAVFGIYVFYYSEKSQDINFLCALQNGYEYLLKIFELNKYKHSVK